MVVERVIPKMVRRIVDDPLGWPSRIFCERYSLESVSSDGEKIYRNDSDPFVVARLAGRFVAAIDTTELLISIVPIEGILEVDDNGKVLQWDPQAVQVWFSHSLEGLSKSYANRVRLIFEKAGITARFRGGILSRGKDCRFTSENLAAFAFHIWHDVLFVWTDRPLALLACHEADVHLYSCDEGLLIECTEIMKRVGLIEAPSPIGRPGPEPPQEYMEK